MTQPPSSQTRPGAGAPRASIVKYKAALRKSIRKNAKEPDIDFLNITAMMDMMTIILVFLLKNMTTSNAAPPQSDDLKLPKSVITGQPKEEGIAIFISKTQIIVGDNTDPVVQLPGREVLAATGIDARYKRNGANDLYIVPLANAMQSVREQDKAIKAAKGEDASKSTAIIIADASTPFRLLLEVIFTLGQAEFGKFHLMVLTGAGAAKLARATSRPFAPTEASAHTRAGASCFLSPPPRAGAGRGCGRYEGRGRPESTLRPQAPGGRGRVDETGSGGDLPSRCGGVPA